MKYKEMLLNVRDNKFLVNVNLIDNENSNNENLQCITIDNILRSDEYIELIM